MAVLKKLWAMVKKRWLDALIIGAALLVIGSAFWDFTQRIWLYDDEWSGEATRSVILTLGGLGALYGLVLAARRLDISETGMFNERLGRGAKLLADNKMRIRSAGVRVLEDLIKSSEQDSDNCLLICRILNDFIRSRAGVYDEKTDAEKENLKSREKRADIELALKVLGKSIKNQDDRYKIINLEDLDLRGLNLEGVKLSYARLNGAQLNEAHLNGAQLNEAHLEEARLEGARLEKAHLERARLIGAHLERAYLVGAHLERARLRMAHLEGAQLWAAHLEGAHLWAAHLEGAWLVRAHLEGAQLWGANLEAAHLRHADISSADFGNAEKLTQKQLNSAIYHADFTSADFEHARNFTPEQLERAIDEKGKPPENLPNKLKMPSDRAYYWEKDKGKPCRRFITSGKWVYEEGLPRPAR